MTEATPVWVREAARHAQVMFPGPVGREIQGSLEFQAQTGLRFFGTAEHELVTEIYRLHSAGFRLKEKM